MTAGIDKIITIFFEDPETTVACLSGSITDAIVHPTHRKRLISSLLRAAIVGLFLATFISPAVEDKFKMNRNEAIAASFIFGYAGIKLLTQAERLAEAEIKRRFGSNQPKETDSSKESVEVVEESTKG